MSSITKYITLIYYECPDCNYVNKFSDLSHEQVNLIGCGSCGKVIYTDGSIDKQSTNDIIKKIIGDKE